jgi:cell wall-associated NlpC family hydrolase
MSYAYAQIGKSVPHYTVAEWNAFPHVPLNQLQPGDLVFFDNLGHVGMYIGGGQMIHAPHTGTVVQISSLSSMGSAPDGAVRP